jgi:hypothetical protein
MELVLLSKIKPVLIGGIGAYTLNIRLKSAIKLYHYARHPSRTLTRHLYLIIANNWLNWQYIDTLELLI